MRLLIALTFFIFIGVSQAYSLTYNLALPFSYKFSGTDYAGNKFEADKNTGWLLNVGFTRWGFGFENYETELKDTSVTLKTTLYDVTYGATGAKEETGWFWKHVGLGYGFGTDVVECSFCESNFYGDDGCAIVICLGFVLVPNLTGFQIITGFQIKGLCDWNVKKQNVLHGKPTIKICFAKATLNYISPKSIS
jgi:hypothetical protein